MQMLRVQTAARGVARFGLLRRMSTAPAAVHVESENDRRAREARARKADPALEKAARTLKCTHTSQSYEHASSDTAITVKVPLPDITALSTEVWAEIHEPTQIRTMAKHYGLFDHVFPKVVQMQFLDYRRNALTTGFPADCESPGAVRRAGCPPRQHHQPSRGTATAVSLSRRAHIPRRPLSPRVYPSTASPITCGPWRFLTLVRRISMHRYTLTSSLDTVAPGADGQAVQWLV